MSKYRVNRKSFNSSMIRSVRYNGRTYYNPKNYPVILSNVATSRNYYPTKYKDYSYLGARWVTENNNRYTGGRSSEYVSYWRSPRLSIFSLALTFYLFLLVFVAAVRISNNHEIVSFENGLKFLEDFGTFSSWVNKIRIPEISISENVPVLARWLGTFVNKVTSVINVFYTLCTNLWKIIYLFFKVLLWIITGVDLI